MPSSKDITVVLVRTQEEGNIGSTARAMANMGLEKLILVAPRPSVGATARAFGVGAGFVLDGARILPSLSEALAPFRRVVGTTSARGRDAAPIEPRRLPRVLAADAPGTPTALVFGPEASGLTTDELSSMHPIVRVPCAPRQPTLNLSQAVLIVAYELHLARLEEALSPDPESEAAAPTSQVEGLMGQVEEILRAVEFARDDTFVGVLRDLRRLAAKAAPSEREVTSLRGICRRAAHRLGR